MDALVSLVVQVVGGLIVAWILFLVSSIRRPTQSIESSPEGNHHTSAAQDVAPASSGESTHSPSVVPVLFLLLYFLQQVYLDVTMGSMVPYGATLIAGTIVGVCAVYCGLQVWRLSLQVSRYTLVWVIFLVAVVAISFLSVLLASGALHIPDLVLANDSEVMPLWIEQTIQSYGGIFVLCLANYLSLRLVRKIFA